MPGTPAATQATAIDPLVDPLEGELVENDQLVLQERDPPMSPFGKAALGAAVGGLVTTAFEFPGGPVLGILAGGVIGYYLPTGQGRGRRRG